MPTRTHAGPSNRRAKRIQYPCVVCTTNVILCDRCQNWCHPNCAWLSDAEYSRLGDSLDTWYCPACCLPSLGSSFFDSTQSISDDDRLKLCLYSTKFCLYRCIEDICSILDSNPIDILTLSETWLDDTILNSEISFPRYSLIRRDRKIETGPVLQSMLWTQLNMSPNLTSS